MQSFEKLLLENKAWAAEKIEEDPEFFTRLEKLQTPEFLWIGCSDSRVPANQITGTLPGEIFVHRNIANMVIEDDVNALSVLEFAVSYLGVKHVIVCGHYGCGGVQAALSDQSFGIIDKWIIRIKDVYHRHRTEIDALPNEAERVNRLSEYNVKQQVINLSKTATVQKAWEKGKPVTLHGWVYGLKDGLLKPVHKIASPIKEPAYQLM